MHSDEVALPDELVEFDVVNMPTGTRLRRMQHQEQMVVVAVDLRHLIAVGRVANRQRVEPERRRQRLLRLVVPLRDVDPDQPVGAVEQSGQLGNLT